MAVERQEKRDKEKGRKREGVEEVRKDNRERKK